MKNIKYILLGASLLSMFLIVSFVFMSYKNDFLSTIENSVTMEFDNKSKVYVLAKSWGITGNHQQITFSQNPIKVPNKETDYIYYTNEVFYKKEGNTLIIFASDSDLSAPNIGFEKIEVKTIGVKNYDEIKDYSDNYKEYGLERITIYDLES